LLKAVGDASAGQKLAMTIEMEEMMISSYSLGGGGGGESVETLTLNATKFTWTYQPQQSTGAVSGNDTTNWNVKTGKKD
jgi:type VI secretion system secreted protein Hcp